MFTSFTSRKLLNRVIKVAPPHYPCGPNEPGQNLEVSPEIGWANAMPDANATVNMVIQGRTLNFTGVGYHDKVRMHFYHSSGIHISTSTKTKQLTLRIIELEPTTICSKCRQLVLGTRPFRAILCCLV